MDDAHRRPLLADHLYDYWTSDGVDAGSPASRGGPSPPVWRPRAGRGRPMWAQALWQRASGVRGHLALHGRRRPTDLGLDPDQGWPGEGDDGGGYVLVLGGHVTGAVLDWYGHPSGPVLERVRAVQASAVESLDEAGRALLIRVYLVTRPRRVLLPSPSPAVVAALARYGGLGLFDVHPRGDENRGG